MHTVWWERNARRHGEDPKTMATLTQLVDKNIRLKLFAVKEKGNYLEED